jgi:hypothetical protein
MKKTTPLFPIGGKDYMLTRKWTFDEYVVGLLTGILGTDVVWIILLGGPTLWKLLLSVLFIVPFIIAGGLISFHLNACDVEDFEAETHALMEEVTKHENTPES